MPTFKPLCFGIAAYVTPKSSTCVECLLARDCAASALQSMEGRWADGSNPYRDDLQAIVESRAVVARAPSPSEQGTAKTLPAACSAGYLSLCKLGVPERIGPLLASGVNPIPARGHRALHATVDFVMQGAAGSLSQHLQQRFGWKPATAHVAASRARTVLSALSPRLSIKGRASSVTTDNIKL